MTVTRRTFVAACVLGASLAFPAYNAYAQNYPPLVKELVAKTRKEIKTTDMAGLKQVLDRKDVVIVDVREPEEYKGGHVPGAVNVPRGLLEFTIWEHAGFPDKLDMAKPMYLYCKTGGRCTFAAKTLQDLGFKNVTAVVMLWDDWVKAGNAVAK